MKNNDFKVRPLTEVYGTNCFNEATLKQRVPKSIFKEFKKVQNGEKDLTLNVAEVIANAMKDWALEKGATHFTHWFQPLTGITAEKHDSFVNPGPDGNVMLEFSGKELIKGEPDASSFPSGGLRATFEARGYTAWDTTSPAFLREDQTGITLYIPTAFVSYKGHALDKKVPLLRSMAAVEKQSLRVLKALGDTKTKKTYTTLGVEQEYFLVEKDFYEKRLDLMHTGRTLLGAASAKEQELTGHYFGTIKERVATFMQDLDLELWKIGVSSKTKHNEVAPNQFEVASVFSTANVATDSNQLTMDIIQKVAVRHGLVALLHEKPFAGVNGSGKHNNWSLATESANLLEPGDSPKDNAQFLVFLSSVIEAVDRYAPLLRLSAASANNDHRLGGHEAPPAIISVFLGDQLSDVLANVAGVATESAAVSSKLEIGVDSLPKLPKDLTDRNRTSPFAFTGNKFEFRMVGSSASTSGPNVILNTIVAEVLSEYADILEKAEDKNEAIKQIITNAYTEHGKVVFNGNGYGEEWIVEAEKRGLPNLKATSDVLKYNLAPETIEVFEKHMVLTAEELESRHNIYSEIYVNQVELEAKVITKMSETEVAPAANKYMKEIADTINSSKEFLPESLLKSQKDLVVSIAENVDTLLNETKALETIIANKPEDLDAEVQYARKEILPAMDKIRTAADNLETLCSKEIWPMPTYEELLYKL
ncbi:glutamine synthetase III [Ilyobacter polytropus]|uniref:L-glutamine synthetase n=1 Tax=Ilyobacter polytropus (strain ATCC 51220 / DSM 2926 / LMG 16218 / CuHBu1) TaxID=572544 RepID=E3HBW1_ILYPC|nr:glutamine synthetase III [Ilyobacter polytropus]ADO84287.1 L-glutamine synthetase [Ilyobacter polytropus DSM 2926]